MEIRSGWIFATFLLLLHSRETNTQGLFPDNRPDGVSGQTFYLDQQSSCRSASSYSVTGKTIIAGHSGVSGSVILSECTITLESFSQKPMKFELEIASMKLNCDLKFYIYDGDSSTTLLKSYDCHKGNDNAYEPIYTSGSKVAFKLIRERVDTNSNYNIRIITETVEAIRTGDGVGTNPIFNPRARPLRKFDQDIIVILMSTAFIFGLLIYAIVLLVYWKRRNKGQEKWTERPMGYDNPGLTTTNSTLAYVEQVKSHPPDDPRSMPMVITSKPNGRQSRSYQTRMAQSSLDTDSVFEGEKGEKPKRRPDSSNGALQNRAYHNQGFQQTPVKSRQRLSHRNASSSQTKGTNSPTGSDVQSSSQDNWRVKPMKQLVPDSDSEDEVERASIGLNTDPEMTDHGVQCDPEPDPEPTKPPPKPASMVTSTGVGNSPIMKRNSPKAKLYHRPPSYEEALSDADFPSYDPRPQTVSPKPQSGVPYIHYSNPTLRRPQPVYSTDPSRQPGNPRGNYAPPTQPQIQEGNIPVYSYLVNRGYHIDDGQSSGDTLSHRSDSRMGHHTDDSDFANLDCGVELMRR